MPERREKREYKKMERGKQTEQAKIHFILYYSINWLGKTINDDTWMRELRNASDEDGMRGMMMLMIGHSCRCCCFLSATIIGNWAVFPYFQMHNIVGVAGCSFFFHFQIKCDFLMSAFFVVVHLNGSFSSWAHLIKCNLAKSQQSRLWKWREEI